MELEMIKEIKGHAIINRYYRLGLYQVISSTYESGHMSVAIHKDLELHYLPHIYQEFSGGFTVQTTSYGSVGVEELYKIIAGYEYAMEAVEVLNKEFNNNSNEKEG